MKNSSRKILSDAAQLLTRHVLSGSPIGELLTGPERASALELANELLKTSAEGGTLVAAVETNGTVLGFIPRIDVVIPEWGLPNPPPASPDEEPTKGQRPV